LRYFDWAATALPSQKVSLTIPFANPSSKHRPGLEAKRLLNTARASCAELLRVKPEHLYWTSGGTESNAIVLFSLLQSTAKKEALVSKVEHASVLENCAILKKLGHPFYAIPVDSSGAVAPEQLEKVLSKGGRAQAPLAHSSAPSPPCLQTATVAAPSGAIGANCRFPSPPSAGDTPATPPLASPLISIMTVNNETGAINNIPGLVQTARAANPHIFFHTDMAQALGKIPIDLAHWDIDAASFSAHKIGGPRGIGLLYLKKQIVPLYAGGGQEGGIRPGTENLEGAVQFAQCMEDAAAPENLQRNFNDAQKRMTKLISALRQIERALIVPAARTIDDTNFSPYILQVAFKNIPGEVMARLLDDAGFCVSTGSACSSGSSKRPVLDAMGVDKKTAFEAIRISQGHTTTEEDIDALVEAIKTILQMY
jgi:cysteine desulfurase